MIYPMKSQSTDDLFIPLKLDVIYEAVRLLSPGQAKKYGILETYRKKINIFTPIYDFWTFLFEKWNKDGLSKGNEWIINE